MSKVFDAFAQQAGIASEGGQISVVNMRKKYSRDSLFNVNVKDFENQHKEDYELYYTALEQWATDAV